MLLCKHQHSYWDPAALSLWPALHLPLRYSTDAKLIMSSETFRLCLWYVTWGPYIQR